MKAHYRLELSVQQLHDLKAREVSPFVAGGCEIVINFLQFPEIAVTPQVPEGMTTDGGIAYNTSNTADFEAEASRLEPTLPTQCRCSLKSARHIQWECPCPLDAQGGNLRSYAMTNTQTGETVGYAHMSCRVYAVVAESAVPVPGPAPVAVPVPAAPATTTTNVAPQLASVGGGKPYIVRVVVDDSKAGKRGGQKSSSVNTAAPESFLYTLQYDVAYQLQSTSEFLATTLRHDGSRLGAAALTDKGKLLMSKIDHCVERIVRLSNIILQVANQLIEDNPAPGQTGTTRDLPLSKEEKESAAHLKRNPVNKLPTPRESSVAHFLTYNVLFQLQCIGSNLYYITAVYHDALEVSMAAIPKQHAEFCAGLAGEVQQLTRQVNIMIQSALDGKLGALPAAEACSSPGKRRTKSKSKSGQRGKKGTYSTIRSRESSYSSGFSSSSSSSSRSSAAVRSPSRMPAPFAVKGSFVVGQSIGSASLTPMQSTQFHPHHSPPPFAPVPPPATQHTEAPLATPPPPPYSPPSSSMAPFLATPLPQAPPASPPPPAPTVIPPLLATSLVAPQKYSLALPVMAARPPPPSVPQFPVSTVQAPVPATPSVVLAPAPLPVPLPIPIPRF